jgi:hypothetical protein
MAKKKTTSTKKKTAATPKKKAAAAPKKKTSAAKSTPKKTAASAKKAAPKKAPAQKTAPKKKAGQGSGLLFRSFERWQPETLYSPPAAARKEAGYAAPAFGAEISRDVLFRKFDIDFAAAAKPPKATAKPQKPAAKPKPASRAELIRKDFGRWKPAALFAPVPSAGKFTAPGFGANVKRDVLFRKYGDIDFSAAAKPPKPVPPPRKPVTREELIRRNFGTWKPASLYAPPAGDKDANYTAPGFGAGVKRDVLTRKFDGIDFAAVAKPPAPPREPVPREELIRKNFGAWKPATPYTPAPAGETAKFAAPPMNDGVSRDIRFRKFDYDFEALAREAEEKRAAVAEQNTGGASGAPSDETVIKLSETKERDPMDRNITFLAAGVILLFILIGAASYSNSSRYYVEPTDDGIEIWQGRFSPLGKKLLADLDGVAAPEPVQPVYSKEAALTLAFDHFMSEVERELAEPTEIDFDELKALLDRTSKFAVTGEQQIGLDRRRTDIRLMTYLFRANAAASRGTRQALSAAAEILEEAALLKLSPEQTTFVERQIELMEDLKAAAPVEAPEEKLEAPEAGGHGGESGAARGEETAEPAHESEGRGATLDL